MPFETIDSTNAAARRMIESGAESGDVVVVWARAQTAGRGRGGRMWAAATGNLYVSIVLPAPIDLVSAPQIGFVAALAVIGAIQSIAPERSPDSVIKCKWPNDVLMDGAKVAGILLETVSMPGLGSSAIIGIGINLNPVRVPDALYPVTSLAEHSISTTAPRLLEALIHDFAARHERWQQNGFESVRAAWSARAARLGETLTIATPRGEVRGTFIGIDGDGAMLLDHAGGARRHRVLAGDVLR